MTFLRDHRLRQDNPKQFIYLANELLDFFKEFEMGAFYRKKIRDHIQHAKIHYANKLRESGATTTPEQIVIDPNLRQASFDHCSEQIESLLIELLRYQQWTAKPFEVER